MRGRIRNIDWRQDYEREVYGRANTRAYTHPTATCTIELEVEVAPVLDIEEAVRTGGVIFVTAESAHLDAVAALAKLRAADPAWVEAVLGEAPAVLPERTPLALPLGIVDAEFIEE